MLVRVSIIIIGLLCLFPFVLADESILYETIEEKIIAEGEADVIITIQEEAQTKTLSKNSKISTAEIEDKMADWEDLGMINAYATTLTKKELQDLQKSGLDIQIYEDRIFKIHPVSQGSKDNSLKAQGDISVPSINATYAHQVLNISGQNITVAVIDTGINYNHTDLGGCFGTGCKVRGGYDYVNSDADPMDDASNSHGTHVAGVIAANGSMIGVAPNATLFALKACNSDGDCTESHVISSISWALTQNASIISMSLGAAVPATTLANTGKSTLTLAVENAVAQGVPVVVSAGNDGSGISTINIPADAPNAITVANSNDQGTISITDDTIHATSSRGPGVFGRLKPDLSAPGTSINSTGSGQGYVTLTGTSMAAPHVSGVAALLLEQNNNLTPSQLRAILIGSAKNISGRVFEKGAGIVSAQAALTNNIYALVNATNSYEKRVLNDKWEFVAYEDKQANITIVNTNNQTSNYTLTLSTLQSMENGEIIDNSSFSYQTTITVLANTNSTFQINFSQNSTSVNISTYAGLLTLAANNSQKNITIPIVVTVPALYSYYNHKSLFTSGSAKGDVLTYAYYNPHAGSDAYKINWSSASHDLDFYAYNSTANLDVYSGQSSTSQENVTSSKTDYIKWVRIHGYTFSGSPFPFTLNLTDTDNTPPQVTSINNKSSNTTNLSFNVTSTVQITITHNDSTNDTITSSINNSDFNITTTNQSATTFTHTNATVSTFYVNITLEDIYGAQTIKQLFINISQPQTTLSIDGYSPQNNETILLKKNDTTNFTINYTNLLNTSVNFSWYINGSLNDTNESFLFNSSLYNISTYNITLIINNSNTTDNVTWFINLKATNIPLQFNTSNNISNFTWNEGSNLSDAINLTEHFYDSDNDTITYEIVNATNITMQITNNSASFIVPNADYYGSETVFIRAYDYDENVTSNTFYLTINDVAESSPPSSSGGGGSSSGGSSSGGSGGGSAAAAVTSSTETTAKTTYNKFFTQVKEEINIQTNSQELSVKTLQIQVADEQKNVQIKIKKYDTLPSSADKFTTKIYEFIEIEHTNLEDKDIEQAQFSFDVENVWLEANGVDPQSIALYRYNPSSNEWDEITTTLIKQKQDITVYEAISPSLSTFLIGQKQEIDGVDAESQEPIQKELQEPQLRVHEENEVPSEPQIEAPKDTQSQGGLNEDELVGKRPYITAATFIVGGIILIISVLMISRHRRKGNF